MDSLAAERHRFWIGITIPDVRKTKNERELSSIGFEAWVTGGAPGERQMGQKVACLIDAVDAATAVGMIAEIWDVTPDSVVARFVRAMPPGWRPSNKLLYGGEDDPGESFAVTVKEIS